jgi:signal peptidase II
MLSTLAAFIDQHPVRWLLFILLVGIGVDQSSKVWAQANLTEQRQVERTIVAFDGTETKVQDVAFIATRTKEIVPGFFNLKYAENPAAAFSLTRSIPVQFRRPFLLLISLVASIGITFWYFKLKQKDALLKTAFALIIAGAIGNLIDRARLAYVIDFLDIYVSSPAVAATLSGWFGTPHWPTFNVADSCIVAGAIGVLWRSFKPLPVVDLANDADKQAAERT